MRRYLSVLAALFALGFVPQTLGQGAQQADRTWVLRNARIVPVASATLERGEILVRGDRIVEIGASVSAPPGAQVVDAGGATVYPGLVDGFTSLAQPENIPQGQRPQSARALQNSATPEGQLDFVAAGVTPEWRVATVLETGQAGHAASAGVTTAVSAPSDGIFPGRAAVMLTHGSTREEIVLDVLEPVVVRLANAAGYPRSMIGAVAAQRQALADASRYQQHRAAPEPEARYAALAEVFTGAPLLYQVAGEPQIRTALRVTGEANVKPILVGGRHMDGIADQLARDTAGVFFSLGLVPSSPGRDDPAAIPAELHRAGVRVAFTSQGMDGYGGLQSAVRRVIAAGMPEEQALRALTLTPAELLGIHPQVGSLQAGRLANFVLASGPLFQEGTEITRVYVAGQEVPVAGVAAPPAAGARGGRGGRGMGQRGGRGAGAGQRGGQRGGGGGGAQPQPPLPALPTLPNEVVIRGGTLLTASARGTIEDGAILIRDGKIAEIGPSNRIATPAGAHVIDASGKYVMPGIIDAHVHTAAYGGINEGSYNVTAETRLLDVIDSRSIAIYRALAGGVTTVHLMHGSSNIIGGQGALLKLKWGEGPDALPIPNAPRTVKFALGENPIAHGGSEGASGRSGRYPFSRMGQEHMLRVAFDHARAYKAEWDAYRAGRGGDVPPRRDLRREALVDILEGRILIQAHSYRADEILGLLRVAEEYDVQVKTVHHALEAYKIGPELAAHGAGASIFLDNWGFKVEAWEAIPHNANLLYRAGVRVSINSDSAERMRRMYWEAAKAVRYGGTPEDEALKMITLHPAWQLGIDHRVGSLELGKDADIAIFSNHPFAVATVCELSMVEGQIYFSREHDLQMRGHPDYPGRRTDFDGEAEAHCLDGIH